MKKSRRKTASDSVFMDRTPKLFLGTVCLSEVLKICGHKCAPTPIVFVLGLKKIWVLLCLLSCSTISLFTTLAHNNNSVPMQGILGHRFTPHIAL
jgi:hypothetical protein